MRLPRRRRFHVGDDLRDDDGITIVEVCVAAFVLAIAVTAVIGVMGSGMGLVGHSRQRTSGTGVAQERLERARNVAYADVALNEQPVHNGVPTHPDYKVSSDGTMYDGEPLIVNLADGGLKHLDDPFTLANTDFTVHQFVTWVEDANIGDNEPTIAGVQSYKRVTVVVTWKFPVHTGPKHSVTQSTFVSNGVITVPSPSASPTPLVTVPPSGGGGGSDQNLGVGQTLGNFLLGLLTPPSGGGGGGDMCAGDLSAPAFESGELLSGSGTDQGYLNSTSVELRFEGSDPECHPISLFMANKTSLEACRDATGFTEVQQLDGGGNPPALNVTWQVPPGDGYKTICAVFQNKDAKASQVWGVNIKLDQTKPTVPGNFAATSCEISGNNRNLTFGWLASTDANLYGYRLYRSIESGPFQLQKLTNTLSTTDSVLKSYSSVRYLVRAYDKAGNESLDSVVLSYAKNKC